jgi:hypothetical protein
MRFALAKANVFYRKFSQAGGALLNAQMRVPDSWLHGR